MSDLEKAKACFMEGITRIQAGDFAGAEIEFRASLDIAPGRISTMANLAVALLKQSKLDEAEKLCRACLLEDIDASESWFNLGLVYQTRLDPEEALINFTRALRNDPEHADTWFYSGQCHHQKRRYEEALNCFERAIALEPEHYDAMCAMGSTLYDVKRKFAAGACFESVLRRDPAHAETHLAMGQMSFEEGRFEEAVTHYRQAIACNHPEPENINFRILALTPDGGAKSSPEKYVAGLFDGYASDFESHLVNKLSYQAPKKLFEHVEPLLRDGADVLDLGCGTGLMGIHLRSKARRLVGLDLSGKMLDSAREKNLYDELVKADINAYLADKTEMFDLIVAADVLVYVGDLADTCRNVARALRPGGLFSFTVEKYDGDGYRLNPSMRFSHSQAYCESVAMENGLVLERHETGFLRSERSMPDGKITGHFFTFVNSNPGA